MWIYWYVIRFTDTSPFGHPGLDIRSCAKAVLENDYTHPNRIGPRAGLTPLYLTHIAVDDANEPGALFGTMKIDH